MTNEDFLNLKIDTLLESDKMLLSEKNNALIKKVNSDTNSIFIIARYFI